MIRRTGYSREDEYYDYERVDGEVKRVRHTNISRVPLWADDTTDSVFGGLALVNRRGKIAKRIRSNLYKNYDIRLPDRDIAELGTHINENASAMGVWYYKLSSNLNKYVGRFGDGGACFQDGYCYDYHRLAMEEDYDTAIALIYDEDKEPYARTWVKHTHDHALVFFNTYSSGWLGQLRTRQIASIVASDLRLATRRVSYTTDVYQNTGWAIAIGGERANRTYDFWYEPENPNQVCSWCDEAYPDDEVYWIESEDGHICCGCLDNDFARCASCDEYHRYSRLWETVHDDRVCRYCIDDNHFSCHRCDLYVGNDQGVELNDNYYCAKCHDKITVPCSECNSVIHLDDANDFEGEPYCDDCYDDKLCEED
jgi:hypothetical protein